MKAPPANRSISFAPLRWTRLSRWIMGTEGEGIDGAVGSFQVGQSEQINPAWQL